MSNTGHRKPIFRPRNIILVILLLLVGWLAIALYRAFSAHAVVSVDYVEELARLGQEKMPPGEDGWPHLEALFGIREQVEADMVAQFGDAMEEMRGFETEVVWDRVYGSPFGGPSVEPELAGLDVLHGLPYLDHVRGLITAPRCVIPMDVPASGYVLEIGYPYLTAARSVCRMLAADAHLAARRGDFELYVLLVRGQLAISRNVGAQPGMVPSMVSGATLAHVIERVQEDLYDFDFPESVCLALLAAFDEAALPDLAYAYEAERLMQQDVVQRMYTDDGNGNGRMIVSNLTAVESFSGDIAWGLFGPQIGRFANLASWMYPTRIEAGEAFDEVRDHLIAMSRLPRWERDAYPFDIETYVDSLPKTWFLIGLLVDALERPMGAVDTLGAMRQSTRLLLALEIHHARHGRWPATLDDLAPAILPEIPIDPLNGKPFGYSLREPTEDDPRPFLLYSFGLDGTDDGGRPHGDQWGDRQPVQDESVTGYDYVYNRPREVWDE